MGLRAGPPDQGRCRPGDSGDEPDLRAAGDVGPAVDGGVAVKPLYVVKVGSSTLDRQNIYGELAGLVAIGARVLLVAGGALGIERHYRAIGREMPWLPMAGRGTVRYCPTAEMAYLGDASEPG